MALLYFSIAMALCVAGQYLNLDTDHNGMLSKTELLKYGTGTLTEVFVNRIFQECLTYDGEVVSGHTHWWAGHAVTHPPVIPHPGLQDLP